jgi:hypothetical protein
MSNDFDLRLVMDDDDLTLPIDCDIQVVGRGTYIHRQYEAASVWRIEHNLHCYPSVTVVDSAESKVTGDVDYIDQNTLTVSFVAPFSGSAYLN